MKFLSVRLAIYWGLPVVWCRGYWISSWQFLE